MVETNKNRFAIIEIDELKPDISHHEHYKDLYQIIKSLEFKQIFYYETQTKLLLDDKHQIINSTRQETNVKNFLKINTIIDFDHDYLYCFTSRELWKKIHTQVKNAYFNPRELDSKKQKEYLTQSFSDDNSNQKKDLLDLINQAKVFKYQDSLESTPKNGIYLLFEKGENVNHINRVVRVGTHTGIDLLSARLKQHYEIENKDRSIFRTNLGRALLFDKNDPYLETWGRNNTTRKIRALNLPYRILDKEILLEKEITSIIQRTFSFSLIEVVDKEYRLYLETALIASFAYAKIKPSQNWLGLKSPVKKIRESGLWQVQGINSTPINAYDLAYIKDHLFFP